ncbi:MAG TPA: DUF2752 domain-containing protein [Chthoniobacterales bacterium]|jgi:hypothetical protein
MRIVARPLAPGEIDHELVILIGSVTGFAMAASWFAMHFPWPICFFHALTGEPCLTCGATRSAIACVHAQFLTAVSWNPLAVLVYGAIALFDVYAVVVLTTRARRLRAYFSVAEKRFLRACAVIILLANWSYLLAHASRFN